MIKSKITKTLILVISLSVLTSCGNTDEIVSHEAENLEVSTAQSDSSIDNDESSETKVITDIEKWSHPIKKYFNEDELVKIELIENQTYPIFYVNHPTISEEDIINNYLDGRYLSMMKANGFWDFEIMGSDEGAIVFKADKDNGVITEIKLSNGKDIDIQNLNSESELIMNAINSRILMKDDLSDYYYLRSPYNQNKRPENDEDYYSLNPLTYDKDEEAYTILLSKKTDKKIIYYHARIDDGRISLYCNAPTSIDDAYEVNHDFIEVEDLFTERYFISDSANNDDHLALKQSPDTFIYRVFVDYFDYTTNMYCIRISRSTDTAQNFFLYNADLDKFYRDGSTPDEIESQHDVFVWVP